MRGCGFLWRGSVADHRCRRLHLLLNSRLGRRLVIPLVVECIGPGAGFAEVLPNQVRLVLLERTGVGLLFSHPDHWEQVEYALRLYLELSRQLIDADFAHS
jgi:hypothetical protein